MFHDLSSSFEFSGLLFLLMHTNSQTEDRSKGRALSLQRLSRWLLSLGSALLTATESFRAKCLAFPSALPAMPLTLVNCILLFFPSLFFLFSLHTLSSLSPGVGLLQQQLPLAQMSCSVCVFILCILHQEQIPPSHYIQLAREFLFFFAAPTSQRRVVEGNSGCMLL